MNADLEKLLTVKDVLVYLQIGRTTLYRLMIGKKIGYVRIGKKVFFTRKHIEDFIRRETVPPKK